MTGHYNFYYVCMYARLYGAGGLWTERAVNIAYVALIVTVFSSYSIYRHIPEIKFQPGTNPPSHRDKLHDDWMESCRKNCANGSEMVPLLRN